MSRKSAAIAKPCEPERLPLGDAAVRPTFRRERSALNKGIWPVAGCDEAGRGPLAGPVVAAAVILDPKRIPRGLNDSKKLSPEERETLYEKICASAEVSVAFGSTEALQRFASLLGFESMMLLHPQTLTDARRAFDPLARIYRESQAPAVRASAVRAIAKIDTLEAGEMLLGILQHEGGEERAAAVEALKRSRGVKFVELARSSLAELPSSAQAVVREILQNRGVSP